MAKRIVFILIFIFFTSVVFGRKQRDISESPLQERVRTELKVRGEMVKQRYIIRFSTEKTKNNLKILSMERDIQL